MRGIPIATTSAACLLVAAAPAPGTSLAVLRHPSLAEDATAPLVAAIGLTGQVLVAWLLLVCLLTLLGRLPGVLGRIASAACRALAPRTVRRAVAVALGVGLAVATPAAAAPPPPPPAPTYDWPTAPVPLFAPAATAPDAAAPPRALPPPDRAVTVRPGDSLWRITAQHLPPTATDAQIARAWPRWWSANRAVIGPNPDLVHPGMRLRPPA